MELEEYINQKKRISSFRLDFIDCEEELERENKFKSLVDSIITMKRTNDDDEIFEFLQLITIIANDHHRIIDFFNKIEIVLLLISDCISKENFQIMKFLIFSDITNVCFLFLLKIIFYQ